MFLIAYFAGVLVAWETDEISLTHPVVLLPLGVLFLLGVLIWYFRKRAIAEDPRAPRAIHPNRAHFFPGPSSA